MNFLCIFITSSLIFILFVISPSSACLCVRELYCDPGIWKRVEARHRAMHMRECTRGIPSSVPGTGLMESCNHTHCTRITTTAECEKCCIECMEEAMKDQKYGPDHTQIDGTPTTQCRIDCKNECSVKMECIKCFEESYGINGHHEGSFGEACKKIN